MKASTTISRDDLLHVGTCLGKFTKTGKFRLHITALEYLSQYCKVRMCSCEKINSHAQVGIMWCVCVNVGRLLQNHSFCAFSSFIFPWHLYILGGYVWCKNRLYKHMCMRKCTTMTAIMVMTKKINLRCIVCAIPSPINLYMLTNTTIHTHI